MSEGGGPMDKVRKKKKRPEMQWIRSFHWAAKYMAIVRWLIYEGVYKDHSGQFPVKKEVRQ